MIRQILIFILFFGLFSCEAQTTLNKPTPTKKEVPGFPVDLQQIFDDYNANVDSMDIISLEIASLTTEQLSSISKEEAYRLLIRYDELAMRVYDNADLEMILTTEYPKYKDDFYKKCKSCTIPRNLAEIYEILSKKI